MEKQDTANSFLPHPPATALNNFMPALPCGLLLESEGKRVVFWVTLPQVIFGGYGRVSS